MIESIQHKHVREVTAIHKLCFPENQSTKFGDNFLKGYYKGHCESDHAVAFVYIEDEKVVGFVIGGVNTQTLSREIVTKSKWIFFQSAVINMFKHPIKTCKKFSEYLKAFILPKKKTFYSDKTSGLASIAVLPEYRGKGIAEKLTQTFLDELKKRGNKACRLGVERDNIRARKFYEKMGFEKVNEEGTGYIYYFDENYKKKYEAYEKNK